MIMQIRNRSGAVIAEMEADSLMEAIQKLVANKANLTRANLTRANLYEANLSGANLAEANLYEADLSGAKINWQSHALLSEILFRAADGNFEREQAADMAERDKA